MPRQATGRVSDFLFRPGQPDEVLIPPNAKQVRVGYQRVLIATPDPNAHNDLSKGKWRKHPSLPAEIDYATVISTVRDSWNRAFSFAEEDPDGASVLSEVPERVNRTQSVSEKPVYRSSGLEQAEMMI